MTTGLTTPDPITLQNALADFVARGFSSCAIEASSIGIAEHRLAGTRVAVAVFTNFTQDHLDYHGDMVAYWQAKAQLFAWPGLRAAVVNLDDAQGVELAGTLAATPIDTWTVSDPRRSPARRREHPLRPRGPGLRGPAKATPASAIATPLIGDYNVSNLLATLGVLRALGVGLAEAAAACSALTPVPGRMQRVGARRPPASPRSWSTTPTRPMRWRRRSRRSGRSPSSAAGRLWCVFGCGGNRDPGKRPLMGAIAIKLAEHVVVTSDNPRLESPDFIISQILAGTIGHDEVDVIENRAEAIRLAVRSAAAADVILIAGKGHEDYQDIGGVKHPFSDAARPRRRWRHECAAAVRGARAAAPGASTCADADDDARRRPRPALPGATPRRRSVAGLHPGAQRHPDPAPRRPVRRPARRALRCARLPGPGPSGRRRRRVGRARPGRGRTAGHRGGRFAPGPRPARRGLAAALRAAAGGGDRQQRQDDGDADDRRHLPRLAGRGRLRHRRQLQQRHRPAADAAAPAARRIAPRWSSSA